MMVSVIDPGQFFRRCSVASFLIVLLTDIISNRYIIISGKNIYILYYFSSEVMNIHTFKDAATAKRNALVNDLDVDDDDQDVAELKSGVIGEEDDGQLQVLT